MCDYSLMSIPNRLAREGEELLAHRFSTGAVGLASSADLQTKAAPPGLEPGTFWSVVKEAFTSSKAEPVPAVCIPPGARPLAAGAGPRTESNDLYHRIMLAVIGAALVLLFIQSRRPIAGRS